MLKSLKEDYSRYSNNKNGNLLRILFKMLSNPGFRAVILYRFGHWFYLKKQYHIAGVLERLIFHSCYCEIKTAAEIGAGFLISHPIGLVIGSMTRIGKNCDVRQNVTFGGNFNKIDKNGRSQPWIEDNVSVGVGAAILGPVKVGANSIIGANSVVISDVPRNMIVSGIPAQVIKERWSIDEKRSL